MNEEEVALMEKYQEKIQDEKYKIYCLEKENTSLKQVIIKLKDKIICYGETFDSDIHKQFQKECLEIIEGKEQE